MKKSSTTLKDNQPEGFDVDGSAFRRPATEPVGNDIRGWLRTNKSFPHLWCPGCGHGIILGAALRAFDSLKYKKDDMVLVSGIGCSGRLPVYVDANTLHTTHGRALTFATGIKLAKPHLKVVVFMGDGDALSIGGNHFIHTCRRNIDMTAVVMNNSIYGMTGGQVSPTTPSGSNTTTTPFGHFAPPFDPCELAIGAGATFVARSTVGHAAHAQKMLMQALEHRGFSVVEIMTSCPVCFGKLNNCGSAPDMIKSFRSNATQYKDGMEWRAAQTMSGSTGRYVIGVLHHNTQVPELGARKRSVLNDALESEVNADPSGPQACAP